jgi:CRISPR/Cas system-associated exonuclease Cas4 (RecB family)
MRISSDLFNAFLKCPTKCWLREGGKPASGNAYAEWMTSQNGSYYATELERLLTVFYRWQNEFFENGAAAFQ